MIATIASLPASSKRLARQVRLILAPRGVTRMVGEVVFAIVGRRRQRSFDVRSVRRVLIIRLDHIGDVILTGLLLRQLRAFLPAAQIAVLVRPHCKELLEHCPHVDEVIAFEPRRSYRWWWSSHREALTLVARRLWSRRFDLVLLPRYDEDHHGETLVAYMTGAPWRVGFRNPSGERHSGRETLLTHALGGRQPGHEVEKHMEMLGFLGATVTPASLELWPGQEDEAFADDLFRQLRAGGDRLVVAFGVGASHAKRAWPVECYTSVAAWLAHTFDARIVVVGDHHDTARARVLQQHLPAHVVDLTARTTLRQAGSVLTRCDLFVGNDSGPAHMAAAAGIATIVMSCHPQRGSRRHGNSPVRFRPWGAPYKVLQPPAALAPCTGACTATEAHCIATIAAARVIDAIRCQLNRAERSRTWADHEPRAASR